MPDQGNRYEFIGERLETPGIVLDDKWMASGREAERLAGGLMDRVKVLAGRYADALPALEARVDTLDAQARSHLQETGVGG